MRDKDKSGTVKRRSVRPKKQSSPTALVKFSTKLGLTKRTKETKKKADLEIVLKEVEIEKTRLEADQLLAQKQQAVEDLAKTRCEIGLIEAQTLKTNAEIEQIQAVTEKTIEETLTLRRWPLIFAVTALTAIAGLATVTIGYLRFRAEVQKREFEIAEDRSKNETEKLKVEEEKLEIFKQQNPEMAKLYILLGQAQEKAKEAENNLQKYQNSHPDKKTDSKQSGTGKPVEQQPGH